MRHYVEPCLYVDEYGVMHRDPVTEGGGWVLESIGCMALVLTFWLVFLWWMTPPPLPAEVEMQGPLVIPEDPYYLVIPDRNDYEGMMEKRDPFRRVPTWRPPSIQDDAQNVGPTGVARHQAGFGRTISTESIGTRSIVPAAAGSSKRCR